jgi:ribonucleotide monophosphatase NagD (HAD superfamily)
MTYVFDIDGTICTLTDGNYKNAEPFLDRIQKINNLHELGNKIVFHTARGMSSPSRSTLGKLFTLTEAQLNTWGVKYDSLILGKPSGDIYVDDKGIKDEDFFVD